MEESPALLLIFFISPLFPILFPFSFFFFLPSFFFLLSHHTRLFLLLFTRQTLSSSTHEQTQQTLSQETTQGRSTYPTYHSHTHTHTYSHNKSTYNKTSVMQRFLNAAVRNNAPTNLNKPLPEPLVDPDEGKIPIGKETTLLLKQIFPSFFEMKYQTSRSSATSTSLESGGVVL